MYIGTEKATYTFFELPSQSFRFRFIYKNKQRFDYFKTLKSRAVTSSYMKLRGKRFSVCHFGKHIVTLKKHTIICCSSLKCKNKKNITPESRSKSSQTIKTFPKVIYIVSFIHHVNEAAEKEIGVFTYILVAKIVEIFIKSVFYYY